MSVIHFYLAFLADSLKPGEGHFILVVVLFNALFTYIQQHESERLMERFRNMLPPMINVLRDGKVSRIEVKFVVPGDVVVVLEERLNLLLMAVLIEVNQLKVDHSRR